MRSSPTFFDRRGNVVQPASDSIIRPRRGVFALVLAVTDRAILLIREPLAPDVPQLPGGGIEVGETHDEALRREWVEETGLAFDIEGPLGEFQHVRGFHAGTGEFWIYDQTFRLYHFAGRVAPGKRWRNGENGEAAWESVESLPDLSVHRAHWCGMAALMPELGQGEKSPALNHSAA